MTIKEIAKLCNVSTSTVSNVINGKNKAGDEITKRILKTIEETGYQPSYIAKGLRTQSTKLIGVIIEDIVLFTMPHIIDGIAECCEKNGYNIILQDLRLYARWHGSWFCDKNKYKTALEPALRELGSISVDGIIYVAGHERMNSDFEKMGSLPIVMAYSFPASKSIPAIVLDDEKGAYDLTKYLISKGHRKIAVLAGERDNLHTIFRMSGYQKALFEEKILFDPQLIQYIRWEREAGYQAGEKVLEQDVTAVFCMSDSIAGGFYDYLREHNMQVGEDISVVGYDNQIMADYLVPKLTTIALPLSEIGYHSAETLIQMLKGEGKPVEMEMKIAGRLLERESVKQINTIDG